MADQDWLKQWLVPLGNKSLPESVLHCLMAPSHYLNQCWLRILVIHPFTISEKMHQNNCKIQHIFQRILCTPAQGQWVNTLRPRQNGRHFADDIFKCIFLNVNVWMPIKISLKLFPQGPINNIPALVQIMAWRRPGDKPLSGPMRVRLPTRICVTRPQWVNKVLAWLRYLSTPCKPTLGYNSCNTVSTVSAKVSRFTSFCILVWCDTWSIIHGYSEPNYTQTCLWYNLLHWITLIHIGH